MAPPGTAAIPVPLETFSPFDALKNPPVEGRVQTAICYGLHATFAHKYTRLPAVGGRYRRRNDVQNTFSFFHSTVYADSRQQKMESPARFELTTSWFVARRSIQLSYGDDSGGQPWNRTTFASLYRRDEMPTSPATRRNAVVLIHMGFDAHRRFSKPRPRPRGFTFQKWRSGGGIEPLACKGSNSFQDCACVPGKIRAPSSRVPPFQVKDARQPNADFRARFELVPSVRFERTTRCLQNSRSTPELRRHGCSIWT